jgi:putative oxygen-independent coproporphyrinogen III oxidase
VTGLYVHVPFCVSKCAYCDFYSLANRLDLVSPYIDAGLAEAQTRAGMSFETMYLGGGTPSLLGAANLGKLVRGLKDVFDLSRLAEATIEVNPESASEELLRGAISLGFNRVSVGVQSLSDRELRSVGRVHTADQAVEAVSRAAGMGFRDVSADVIVGLPGQTLGSLRRTLEGLVALGANHLSVYCLSLEEGTPLATSPPNDLPSDDVQADLFGEAQSVLGGRGFVHYEISNFCLPGRECRHNLNYWRGGEYLGLGPAAASHLGGRRWKNRADLPAYVRDPFGVVGETEGLGLKEKAAEEAMLRLRLLVEGLSEDDMARRFGEDEMRELFSRLDGLVGEGLLTFDGLRYRLPCLRVLTSNPILARVLA